jgi:putative ABC transport system substrate-binding protein
MLGIEGGGAFSAWQGEFPAEFRRHGFVEGRNLQLLWFAVPSTGPRGQLSFAELREGGRKKAAEMAAAGLDCMVANGEPHTRFLQEASRVIPTVVNIPDPVGFGFVKSLAKPGGNLTGLHDGHEEVCLKTAELFRKLIPGLACAGWIGPENFRRSGEAFEAALRKLGMRFHAVSIRNGEAADAERVGRELATLKRQGCAAFQVAFFGDQHEAILGAALANRIALSGISARQRGFLFAYSTQRLPEEENVRRIPATVARILRGEAPGDIPFEGPSRYQLGINLKTAALLGITVPADVRVLADEVIPA